MERASLLSPTRRPVRRAASRPRATAVTPYPDRGRHGRTVAGLGGRIVRGDLKPGTTLEVESLQQEFGVSRTVIREAFKVLASKGLIESRQHRGTQVCPPSAWSMLDPDVLRWRVETAPDVVHFERLSEVRFMIEPEAARLAASRRTAEDVEQMSGHLAEMAIRQEFGETSSFVAADVRFHGSILASTHNDMIMALYSVIEAGLATRDSLVHSIGVRTPDSIPAHRKVLHAIIDGDGEGARSSMESLLRDSGKVVLDLFNDAPGTP